MAEDPLNTRVAAILDRLSGLSRMSSGMPVRAEDWNTVIGAVIDVARLFSVQAVSSTSHAHTGQVSRDWLDPALTDFVDSTRQLQQAQADQLRALSQRVDRVEQQLATLSGQVGTLQSQADRTEDQGMDRELTLKRIGERVDGHDQLSSQVGDLRSRLTTLEPRITDAVGLRAELSGQSGALPDLGLLVAQVADLSTLRENLRVGDGTVGRLRDLERRIDTFEQIGTNDDALGVRVDEHVRASIAELSLDPESLGARIDDRVTSGTLDLRGTVDGLSATVDTLGADMRDVRGLPDRVGALEASGAETSRLGRQVAALESWQAAIDPTVTNLRNDVEGLRDLRDQIRTLDLGLRDLTRQVAGIDVGQTVDLRPLELSVRALDERLVGIERQSEVWVTRDELGRLQTDIAITQRELAALQGQVTFVDNGLNDLRTITDARISTLEGRTNALNDANARMARDMGTVTLQLDNLRVGNNTVFRVAGPTS